MKFTFGKLIWGISIILFLLFSYSQDTFYKVYYFVTGTFIEKVHDKVDAGKQEEKINIGVGDIRVGSARAESSDAEFEAESIIIEENDSLDFNNVDTEMYLQMELLKYRVQELEEEYDELKTEIKSVNIKNDADEEGSMDSLLAIVTTLLPVIIPYLTRKSHDKEITIFKKG